RKDLLAPERLAAEREHAFRFRHLLIRDAAYAALPKEARAGLHERAADWLQGKPGEYEEIMGYHLEQAVGYRSELGLLDDRAREVAARGGDHLAAAGRRALARGDVSAAVKLLHRAASLFRTDGSPRPDLLVDLSVALREDGDLGAAGDVLREATAISVQSGDELVQARAELERSFLRALVDPTMSFEILEATAGRVIPVFDARGDDRGLAQAWRTVAQVHWLRCRCAPMEDALERALVHAERATDEREVSEVLNLLVRAIVLGPKPVDEAIPRCEELRRRAEEDVGLSAWIDAMLAVLEAMRGEIVRGRRLYRMSAEVLHDRGLKMSLAGVHFYAGIAELVAGEPHASERELRVAYSLLEQMGERAQLSTTAAILARSLVAQGRSAEAERFVEVSRESAGEDDVASQAMWRQALGKVLVRCGEGERAEALLREAVTLVTASDFLNVHADAVRDLGEALLLLGRVADARPVLEEAIRLYEAKGNAVSAAAARASLAEAPTAVVDPSTTVR
ncbi:MAG: adenylate/guanylate cyclase domain-containing protein, partial [Actinomycetota bacterium]|nr:adenylate/guanylate cyclase domain-containing protein [Actinomycetota bacterium]